MTSSLSPAVHMTFGSMLVSGVYPMAPNMSVPTPASPGPVMPMFPAETGVGVPASPPAIPGGT